MELVRSAYGYNRHHRKQVDFSFEHYCSTWSYQKHGITFQNGFRLLKFVKLKLNNFVSRQKKKKKIKGTSSSAPLEPQTTKITTLYLSEMLLPPQTDTYVAEKVNSNN